MAFSQHSRKLDFAGCRRKRRRRRKKRRKKEKEEGKGKEKGKEKEKEKGKGKAKAMEEEREFDLKEYFKQFQNFKDSNKKKPNPKRNLTEQCFQQESSNPRKVVIYSNI